jgi:cytidine deaminase
VYSLAVSGLSEIPWDTLRARAREASTKSYSPYSHVRVGAAGVTSDGRILEGSNVENASYGLTLCAECALVGDLARQGGGELVGVAVVAGDGEPLTPCGRCRQLLFEHGGADLLVDAGGSGEPVRLAELLPGAFGPSDLGTRSTP